MIAYEFSFTETELWGMPLRRMLFWGKRLRKIYGSQSQQTAAVAADHRGRGPRY